MRIALVAPLVTPIAEPQAGGSQALLSDLAQELAGRGHDVDVFAATGSAIEGVNVVDTGVDPADLAETLFHSGALPPTSHRAEEAFSHVWWLVAAGDYDVAHNHAFDPPAIYRSPDAGIPVVHTLHLPPDPAVAAAVERLRAARVRTMIATVAEHQARAWGDCTKVDAVLRNGVAVARIPMGPGGSRVLFAGRLSAEKGAAEAIEIAAGAGVGIDLVGGAYDPAYTAERIEPLIDGKGARLHPPLPRPRLWDLMGGALAVLCPVRWEEPFGLVAAEAQAAGTPVVGFRRGGLPEVVADGVTGRLVDDGDLRGASAALAAAGELSRERCRRHAESHLDLGAATEAHERLYASLISGTGTERKAR